MITRFLLGLAVALLSCGSALAQGQTYAVVVGIADYAALTSLSGDLRFADRDARQVAAFLRSKTGGQVPASQIRVLTNRQATLANIQHALTLFRKARPGDRVILYFSGHGMPASFVPYDARAGAPRSVLTYATIKAAFRQSAAATKLCIADACLSGGLQRTQNTTSAQTLTDSDSKSKNVALLLASRETQSAIEDQRLAGGLFTHYLLRGLGGRADRNTDRIVTIRELHQYVSPRLQQTSRGRQTPIFYGRFSDDLALAYL